MQPRWTAAHQAPLSVGFLSQEYWSGLPFPSPGDLPSTRIKPACPALTGGFPNHRGWRAGLSNKGCNGEQEVGGPHRQLPTPSSRDPSHFRVGERARLACDPRTNLEQHLSLWRLWSTRLRGSYASSNVPGGLGVQERPSKTPPFTPLQDVTCGLTMGGDPRGPFVGQATQTRPGCLLFRIPGELRKGLCPHTMPSGAGGWSSGSPGGSLGRRKIWP